MHCLECGEDKLVAGGLLLCPVCDSTAYRHELEQAALMKARVARRRCRDCQGVLPPTRYFCCKRCLKEVDRPSDDGLMQDYLSPGRSYCRVSTVEVVESLEAGDSIVGVGAPRPVPVKKVKPMPAFKLCRSCLTQLPSDQFHKHTVSADGLRNMCKRCISVRYSAKRKGASREMPQLSR